MDNPQLRGRNNFTTDDLQISKGLDPISPLRGSAGDLLGRRESLPSICESCKAFGHATGKCKAKKPVEDSEGWIKVEKGKGKAPEAHSGGQISEIPSSSRMQPEVGIQKSIVAVRTVSMAGEAAKVGVGAPVEKESTENLGEEAAKEVTVDLVEEENQTAEHRQAATPPDSEEEDLQLEGGARDLIMDEFDRPVVSPKDPPDKKTSSSKKKKKR
ncbi:hypothetical protein U1Q18_019640 [Sarracenia purpurea var. burkii]